MQDCLKGRFRKVYMDYKHSYLYCAGVRLSLVYVRVKEIEQVIAFHFHLDREADYISVAHELLIVKSQVIN